MSAWNPQPPEQCEHVSKDRKDNEKDALIEYLLERERLLVGCIMEICDVVFSSPVS